MSWLLRPRIVARTCLLLQVLFAALLIAGECMDPYLLVFAFFSQLAFTVIALAWWALALWRMRPAGRPWVTVLTVPVATLAVSGAAWLRVSGLHWGC